jgi:hypothetical protein
MTEPSDTHTVADFVDHEKKVYVVQIDERLSERFTERLAERFGKLFRKASVLCISAELEGDVRFREFDKDDVKEQIEAIEKGEVEEVDLETWGEDDG